jgi:hypothetical protein
MPGKRESVSDAVTICLAFCMDAPDAQTLAAQFLLRLSRNPEWTADEVEEVRRQIEARLSSRTNSVQHPQASTDIDRSNCPS